MDSTDNGSEAPQESEARPLEGAEAHKEDTALSQRGGDVRGLGRERKASEEP